MPLSIASINRIHDSLHKALSKKRIIFWYDPEGEWESEFENYKNDSIKKHKVDNNEFSIKVEITRSSLNQKFLLYFKSSKPNEKDNWLLDLLLCGDEFTADRSSLDLQDVGLPLEFKQLAKEHKTFFRAPSRKKKLKQILKPNDDETSIRLKMLAVITNTQPSIDRILLHCFNQYDPEDQDISNSINNLFAPFKLINFFWTTIASKFGYLSKEPNILDFAVELFKSSSSLTNKGDLEMHAKVFLSDWKDSRQSSEVFIKWSKNIEHFLKVDEILNDQLESFDPDQDDCFESIELFTIHRILKLFIKKADRKDILQIIKKRETSFWFNKHKHGYQAVLNAINLANLIDDSDLELNSFEEGLQRYCKNWWKLDKAYRLFIFHSRTYSQPGLLKELTKWVENNYVNNVLLLLNNKFSDQVKNLEMWKNSFLPSQKDFYSLYVNAQLKSKKLKRIFVIISDALRYEAAKDFSERLNNKSEKVWEADINAMLGVLPSYTQLGMAALLPGNKLSIDIENPNAPVKIDGSNVSGKDNREKKLNSIGKGFTKAINSEDFLNLSTSKDGSEIIKKNTLIMIYHNRIDRIGDKLESESETCKAIEDTFDDLEKILRKVSSFNGSNVVITSDHGFLFQQDAVDTKDKATFPNAYELRIKKKRFAIGDGIDNNSGQKIFSAKQLGIEGSWQAVFPLGIDRFPLSGAGNRFVHGGISLQENVIPVIKLKRKIKSYKQFVKAEILRLPDKITTPRIKFGIYQTEPYEEINFMPLKLKILVIAKKDDSLLCEPKIIKLDFKSQEPRNREHQIILDLSNSSSEYNNEILILKLEQLFDGIRNSTIYFKKEIKLLQPFGNDFEDF